ncbi:MAG: hypothetical protein GOV15_01100 [Candidatus Diapherotrites archaeon]|nr:hypothetical protein [Candidatus Diapherotrites archaeon]
MRFRAEFGLAFWVVLSLLFFVSTDVFNWLHGLGTLVFEGFSFGKILIFLIWEIVFFLALVLKAQFFPRFESKAFQPLVLVLFSGFLLGFMLQANFFADFEASNNSYVGVLTTQDGVRAWEATYLKHTHLPKVSFGFVQSSLNSFINTADSGFPMFQALPNSSVWAVIFLLLITFGLILALFEGMSTYTNKLKFSHFLFSIGFFGSLATMLDGGIFTQGAIVSIALLVLYGVLEYFPSSNGKFFALLFLPLGVTVALQSFFSSLSFGLFSSYLYFTSEENIVLIASILAVISSLNLKIKRDFFTGLVLIGIAYLLFQPVQLDVKDVALGSASFPGETSSFFLYGLPDSAYNSDVLKVLEKYGTVTSFERSAWTALVEVKANQLYTNHDLENSLREELNPETYLYAVRLWQDQEVTVIDPNSDGLLLTFDSKIVSVLDKGTDKLGRDKIVIRTRLNPTWTNLFVMDYLSIRGRSYPITLVTR